MDLILESLSLDQENIVQARKSILLLDDLSSSEKSPWTIFQEFLEQKRELSPRKAIAIVYLVDDIIFAIAYKSGKGNCNLWDVESSAFKEIIPRICSSALSNCLESREEQRLEFAKRIIGVVCLWFWKDLIFPEVAFEVFNRLEFCIENLGVSGKLSPDHGRELKLSIRIGKMAKSNVFEDEKRLSEELKSFYKELGNLSGPIAGIPSLSQRFPKLDKANYDAPKFQKEKHRSRSRSISGDSANEDRAYLTELGYREKSSEQSPSKFRPRHFSRSPPRHKSRFDVEDRDEEYRAYRHSRFSGDNYSSRGTSNRYHRYTNSPSRPRSNYSMEFHRSAQEEDITGAIGFEPRHDIDSRYQNSRDFHFQRTPSNRSAATRERSRGYSEWQTDRDLY